ncbi:two-component system sensor histidine kinase MtrB [Actinokineospora auranticolor]|uniref:Sensor histidine kinase MtrB n=1 Tax=Actinokineospora auranticolor TaxID=155976 RepID=A0A2S6GX63_9PSEU|nr:two-component system sensor histidine kinase MtrB [Actinokineospora auranticolor]
MTGFLRRVVGALRGLLAAGRHRTGAFSELWRSSLQLRVAVSTLALGSAVTFVLGMVVQNQITERLLGTKESAAIAQTRAAVQLAETELVGISNSYRIEDRLSSAINKLTSSSPGAGAGSAGAFEPVLVNDDARRSREDVEAAGPYDKVPQSLRDFVLSTPNRTVSQIYTVDRGGERITYLMVGAPVTTTNPAVQLYMLYPLSAEQRTVDVVQSTILVGGLVLLLLLAGITNLVTRQVVLPVRRAARAAARFADGELDERMVVAGEDDVAQLAQSYNEMAESIANQIRQLEDFGQLQRRFTSDVSHELRTPLTTVRMAADVLHASRAQFPAGLARSTELLVDELDRFESLLGDLLEISRLDAGVEDLVAEYADLRAIARRAVESVRVIARNAGSEIILDLPEDEVTAEVESRRIERILRNLLANAIDHGEGRPVELRMVMGPEAVAVTVRDHGVGLRTGEADLVFNRFWRADPSRNRHTGGTGLGLAISLEDARLHGGGLDAWGEPGDGACFRLTLPREQGIEYGESPLPLPPADVRPITQVAQLPLSVTEEVYP